MKTVYLIILFIAIIEACAQFCLKKGHDTNNKFFNYFGFISYGLVGILLLKSYSYIVLILTFLKSLYLLFWLCVLLHF